MGAIPTETESKASYFDVITNQSICFYYYFIFQINVVLLLGTVLYLSVRFYSMKGALSFKAGALLYWFLLMGFSVVNTLFFYLLCQRSLLTCETC